MSRPISTASANRLLGGLSITALAMMLVPAASAQVAPSVAPEGQVAPADAPPPLAAPEDNGPDIVVTGSYLGNVRQEDRASPILSIDSQSLARTGVTSLGDITRFIPPNVGSAGGIQDLAKGGTATCRPFS